MCLNEDTSDRFYSGADFHKGVQRINAAQAMAFVRQRRDANDALFTDLDRTRRQQAFMASVVTALRHGGALSSPSKLHALLDVAQQNVAIDAGFDLAGLIPYASAAIDRSVMFYTLPVTDFRTLPDGEDVNIIDAATIRSIVHSLLAPDSPSTPASTENVRASAHPWANPEPTAHRVALDVINASGQDGVVRGRPKSFGEGAIHGRDGQHRRLDQSGEQHRLWDRCAVRRRAARRRTRPQRHRIRRRRPRHRATHRRHRFSHLRVRRQARLHIGRHHNERGAKPHRRAGDSRWQ